MDCINKKDIILKLREKSGVRGASLPRDIDFFIKDKILYVNVKKTVQNMQANGAAFEGWILLIKSWLEEYIDKVELDYIVPEIKESYGSSKAGHYNRFLYRLYNMLRLFPNWFTVNESKKYIIDNFIYWLKSNECLLNHSLKERKSVIGTDHMERKIESWFVYHDGKHLLEKVWNIDSNKLYNQLPMGVFLKEIKADNAIFTRTASAIDLWGIGKDNNSLHIIELKCKDNIGLGVISELLFYTFVIYDVCINKNSLFEFSKNNAKVTEDIKAIRNNGNKFSKLYTHILAEKYHPLFNYRVENEMKKGLYSLNIEFDKKKYVYSKKVILD